MSVPLVRLGKYAVLEEIGRGGMGTVYRARDPFLDRCVAIKVLAPHLVWEKTFLERFAREARAAARLQHPNIVPVFDVGQDGTNYYYVMAYMPGASLRERLAQRGRLCAADTLAILRPLAAALDYAHSKNLVHRDVKPANVMFDERGEAMLTDFGIVKALQQSGPTSSGHPLGTPQYMAPEQAMGQDVDGRADQYALAIMTYEMLAGAVPFDAPTIAAILYKQVYEAPPSVSTIASGPSRAVDIVLYRALSKTPSARYDTCGLLVEALANLLQSPNMAAEQHRAEAAPGAATRLMPGRQLPAPPVVASAPVAEPQATASGPAGQNSVPTRRRVWAARGGAAALVFAALLVWYLGQTSIGGLRPVVDTFRSPRISVFELGAGVAIESVQVQAGKFRMGSSETEPAAFRDEAPEHVVYLDEYEIGRFEVTVAQFRAFVESTGYRTTAETEGRSLAWTGATWEPVKGAFWREPRGAGKGAALDQDPVTQVSWIDAVTFCQWASRVTGRVVGLPTEAQWEKAARGTDRREYPWGSGAPSGVRLNSADRGLPVEWANSSRMDGYLYCSPVGSFPVGSSPYGALDMSGNVSEWVMDLYADDYYYFSPSRNPAGPESGDNRGLRGGNWGSRDSALRTASRGYDLWPSTDYIGFRVVVS